METKMKTKKQTTISIIFLSAVTFSGACLAKEKMFKDPFGTSCKASELLKIASISEPKPLSEMPNAPPDAKKDKNKYVALKFVWDQGDLTNDEIYLTAKEVKKLKLQKGDKKYCLMSISGE